MVSNNHFVEAHEVLEEDWKKLKKEGKKDEAKFLQALINGATSIALWIKKRPEQCYRIWTFFQRNKHLISTIDQSQQKPYLFAIKLLEDKFINYTEKDNL